MFFRILLATTKMFAVDVTLVADITYLHTLELLDMNLVRRKEIGK